MIYLILLRLFRFSSSKPEANGLLFTLLPDVSPLLERSAVLSELGRREPFSLESFQCFPATLWAGPASDWQLNISATFCIQSDQPTQTHLYYVTTLRHQRQGWRLAGFPPSQEFVSTYVLALLLLRTKQCSFGSIPSSSQCSCKY